VIARCQRRALFVTLAVTGAAAMTFIPLLAGAQKLADEPSRQEALQRFRVGQEFMSGEQFERAAEEFGKAIEFDHLLSIAHYQRGQAFMNLRRYASAAKSYRDCIEAERELFALTQTNRFEVDKKRDDEILELRRVLDQQSSSLQRVAVEQRLRDLQNQRQRGVTSGSFQAPAQVLLALGSAYFRNGDSDGAEAQWRAAIDANPKLGEAHNNIAVIYMQTGRFDQALQELTLAEKAGFKVNPQFKADLKERAKATR